jgi:hypothetical protein
MAPEFIFFSIVTHRTWHAAGAMLSWVCLKRDAEPGRGILREHVRRILGQNLLLLVKWVSLVEEMTLCN